MTARLNCWRTEAGKIQQFERALGDEAQRWYDTWLASVCPEDVELTYDMVATAFFAAFARGDRRHGRSP
jgi:hypothetical protein